MAIINQIFVSEVIRVLDKELDNVSEDAKKHTSCLRKAVGCSLVNLHLGNVYVIGTSFNGPARLGYECKNIVGACGCSHSEPRAIMKGLKSYSTGLVMLCSFSPCVNCANIIIDSGLIQGLIYDQYAPHHPEGLEMLIQSNVDVMSKLALKEPNEAVHRMIYKWMQIPPTR